MRIRKALPADIPKIVQVLKSSLGDHLPLSEEIWNFKHVVNPFGASIVLVAEEDEKIIGVRAFMKWKLSHSNKAEISTYRAVDTATHPAHRGKGIFKKLTLKAVEVAKEEQGDFIFNCPNDMSRPGYLKMGWEQIGKINVGIKPSLWSFWKFWSNPVENEVQLKANDKEIEVLCEQWNSKLRKQVLLFTPKSSKYLKWRYENNPLKTYLVHATPHFYLSASIEKRKGTKELRITECIFLETETDLKQIKKIIRKWSLKFGVQAVSFSQKLLDLGNLAIKGEFGPILTVRDLNLQNSEKINYYNINKWNYSLGDIELF